VASTDGLARAGQGARLDAIEQFIAALREAGPGKVVKEISNDGRGDPRAMAHLIPEDVLRQEIAALPDGEE
jgi:hypothetical protein